MSHSKRNTSLAFFTAHERSLLRSSWGSQSTRLTRDSFLPFGYCRLCLGIANDPVACDGGGGDGKVHLFCRECALNDLVSQRKEIKRLELGQENRAEEERERKEQEDEDRRERDIRQFERAEMGFSDGDNGGGSQVGGAGRGVKRKREATEMHSSSANGSAGRGIEAATALKKGNHGRESKENNGDGGSSESSFWIPSLSTTPAAAAPLTKSKLHPLCPASTPENKHSYSLKTLVTVRFTEIKDDTTGASEKVARICPSCKKVFNNASRAKLGTATGCGHVVCGNCADLFTKASSTGMGSTRETIQKKKDKQSAEGNHAEVRCFICEADLSGHSQKEGSASENRKKAKGKDKNVGRLIEISCEGTGFAGGGTNMAKREGVAFQC